MSSLESTPGSTAHGARESTAVRALLTQHATDEHAVASGRAIVEIVAQLTDDEDILTGAMLFALLEANALPPERAEALAGAQAARIGTELLRVGSLNIAAPAGATASLSGNQSEGLRKMLLAIVTDPRLVLIKLAAQLHKLRESKDAPEAERQRLAYETRQVYAPLANRLGVWQLKWQLEDWSFRYLEPDNYKRVAGWLASKRGDRERYIEDVIATLRAELTQAQIDADIAGRPKHIYSIWRKSQRKGLAFDQLFDVRAVRVLVATIADCYAALGIVHGLWPYIPGEFDDYIATPKDNAYRSLHTAVIGPGKLPLEIQIRTRDMHEHAELGVASHWRYKEGGRANPAYEQKIIWLRQLLEPGERQESDGDFLERVRSEVFEDRVYALSPRGEVIELQRGSTPLDFAYHVHTDLGHRCRGAKVNGRMVALNTVLANGDQVEIVTGKQLNPSRDWLVPSLGYLASPRNRSKVRAWFRKLDEDQNRQQGKQILERELQRLAIHSVTLPELIGEFHLSDGRPAVPGDRRGRHQRRADQRRGSAPRQAAGAALPHLAPADGQRQGNFGHHDRRRRRPAVDLRALLRTGAAGSNRGLHHDGTRRQHPPRRLRELSPAADDAPRARPRRGMGQARRACFPDRRDGARVRPARTGARHQRGAGRFQDQHPGDERLDRRARRYGRDRAAHHRARYRGAVARARPDPGAVERAERASQGLA